MNDSVRSIWTAAQQSELERLIQLKAGVIAQNQGPIVSFIRDSTWFNSDEDYELRLSLAVNSFMNNAEQIRDFLEPFDGRKLK